MTFRHLESGQRPNTNHRWHDACILCDADARRCSNAVRVDRLQDMSTLRQEVSALSVPYVQRPDRAEWHAGQGYSLTHARQLQGVVDEFMTKMTALLRERKPVLDDLRLPLEACIRLPRIAIDPFRKTKG